VIHLVTTEYGYEGRARRDREAFRGKLNDEEIDRFIDATTGSTGIPSPITATGSAYFGLTFGVVKCTPASQPYPFEEKAWGIGATAGSGAGLVYTAYGSWDALFSEHRGYHAQGIADGGGILQINFFNSSAIPIGQYNGVTGGIDVFECGGKDTWQHT
jgi:hypothetical protein